MSHRSELSRCVLLVAITISFLGLSTRSMRAADEGFVRTELPLKTPRSRDPVLGGARDKVFFKVWFPQGAKPVRGAMCNPFSKDDAVSAHWQAACRLWNFAYIQTDFDAVKKEEFLLLPTALIELAKTSGHAEIEHVPFCWTGMSRGGGMSMQLSELLPHRTIASVPVCLEVGPANDATRLIPVLTVFGEKDGSQMEKLLSKLPPERQLGARWSIAVQWNRKHEFALANNVSFVFLDDVIARRVPQQPSLSQSPALGTIPLEDGWLGDVSSWGKDGRRPTIQSWRDYSGDRNAACWFPTQRAAATWAAFVSGTKEISITEPAGLGDGQKFALHPSSKPVSVKLSIDAKLKPTKLELWDAHQRLAERSSEPWSFEATLPPGIHSLYVTAIEEGRPPRSSRPHTIVVE